MKRLLVILIILLSQFSSRAQEFPTEYFSSPVTWLGLDYSHAKMIGAQGFNNPDQIVDYYFENWNKLVMTESRKYNLPSYLIADVSINLKYVRAKNKAVDAKEIVVEEANPLSGDQLEKIVMGYDFSELSGFGAIMIVEAYNKNEETATYHFLVMDLASNKILYKNTYKTEPAGFGFRNYWAATFLGALKSAEKDLNSWYWKAKKDKTK